MGHGSCTLINGMPFLFDLNQGIQGTLLVTKGIDNYIGFSRVIMADMDIFIQSKKSLKLWINLKYSKLKLKINTIKE